jgi:ATP-dependent Clp protease ATP-binding subunit ClpA
VFERFTREAKDAVKRSQDEAARLRSPTIESEHLLLALAAPASGPAAAVLVDAGLDRERLLAAFEAELEGSLAAIGVPAAELLEQAPPSGWGSPRWGASAKLALERSLRAAEARHDRRILPAHLLLGVLRAELGTLPRALRRAGVEPAELAARMGDALDVAA